VAPAALAAGNNTVYARQWCKDISNCTPLHHTVVLEIAAVDFCDCGACSTMLHMRVLLAGMAVSNVTELIHHPRTRITTACSIDDNTPGNFQSAALVLLGRGGME